MHGSAMRSAKDVLAGKGEMPYSLHHCTKTSDPILLKFGRINYVIKFYKLTKFG